jgi:flagellar assembly factor FliW
MPTLTIQGTVISYDEKDIITFAEGLIGLPHLRRMVIVRQTSIEPFLWLVSLDDDGVAFVVTDAPAMYSGYQPSLPADSDFPSKLGPEEKPIILAIVLIAPEWQRSTANLRAPLFISASSMTGIQMVLLDNSYNVGEPLAMAA